MLKRTDIWHNMRNFFWGGGDGADLIACIGSYIYYMYVYKNRSEDAIRNHLHTCNLPVTLPHPTHPKTLPSLYPKTSQA